MRQMLLLLAAAGLSFAQAPRPNPTYSIEPEMIALWEGRAPGALGDDDADRPTLACFRPSRPTAPTAIIIAPGGGYVSLASNHEGRQLANFFNAMGVTAFVLKYRLGPRYRHPVELGDMQRAIRLVRSRAQEFGVAPDRIGIMGFSAGGHLVTTAATHYDSGNPAANDPVDRASSRPDFLIVGYGVISFDPAITHAGSVRSLLGENPDPKLIAELSNERHVTPQTPPTFLFHTANDSAVPVENSVRFFQALRTNKVSAEMHIYSDGPHGVGMALSDPALSSWTGLLANWLRARGLLTK